MAHHDQDTTSFYLLAATTVKDFVTSMLFAIKIVSCCAVSPVTSSPFSLRMMSPPKSFPSNGDSGFTVWITHP